MGIISKKCTRCQNIKDISEFNKRLSRPCGYISHCKKCQSNENKEWRETGKIISNKSNRNNILREEAFQRMIYQIKTCSTCNQTKMFEDFEINKKSYDGKQSNCKECKREGRITSIDKNKKQTYEKLNKLKSNLGCLYCNEDSPKCLDFHHLNPETKIKEIARIVAGNSKDKLIIELPKCELFCANCHRKHHDGLKLIEIKNKSERSQIIIDFCDNLMV